MTIEAHSVLLAGIRLGSTLDAAGIARRPEAGMLGGAGFPKAGVTLSGAVHRPNSVTGDVIHSSYAIEKDAALTASSHTQFNTLPHISARDLLETLNAARPLVNVSWTLVAECGLV